MNKDIKPYKELGSSKKKQVAEMFDNISSRYDFLNHLLSLSIDKGWRNKVVKMVQRDKPGQILDVATGTADLAIAMARIHPEHIKGIDISNGMLEVGRKKVKRKGLTELISLEQADSENLPYGDASFDAITVAFGVRNFEDLEKGLREIHRVLRPGGRLLILEFSQPQAFPFKQIYNFYFRYILPTLGKMVSQDSSAYSYLPESVGAFPFGNRMTSILENCEFRDNKFQPVTFGIATIYDSLK